MARYRLLIPRGVHDTQAPAHDVMPSNYSEWRAYQAWLAAGNAPDAAIPPPSMYPTLISQRVEMLARLDGLLEKRRRTATFAALGHTWRLQPGFIRLLILARITTPPMPPGFGLPDSARVQVTLTNAELSTVCEAARDRLLAFGVAYTAIAATINASPTPLAVDINAGWP